MPIESKVNTLVSTFITGQHKSHLDEKPAPLPDVGLILLKVYSLHPSFYPLPHPQNFFTFMKAVSGTLGLRHKG